MKFTKITSRFHSMLACLSMMVRVSIRQPYPKLHQVAKENKTPQNIKYQKQQLDIVD